MRESAETHCDFFRSGGLCHLRPDGIDTCKYWREDAPTCRYLTLYVLRGRGRGRGSGAKEKAWATTT